MIKPRRRPSSRWLESALKAIARSFARRAMIKALREWDQEGLERALRRGACPNETLKNGLTPLTMGALGLVRGPSAARRESAERAIRERAELLIAWGADVNLANRLGDRPWHAAMSQCSTGLCEALAGAGALADQPDAKGRLPRERAGRYPERLSVAGVRRVVRMLDGEEAALAILGPCEEALALDKEMAAPKAGKARVRL